MKNTIIKRIFSIFLGTTILTTTILAASLPISAVPVYADNDKTISGLCTGAIANPTSGAGGWSYVYYGKYNNAAMKYRVLDIAATQFGGNTMLLDCDSTIEKNMRFDGDSNVWANSEIRTWLNGNDFYGNASVFTAQEKAAIAISTKETPDTSDPNNKDGDGSPHLSYAVCPRMQIILTIYSFLMPRKQQDHPMDIKIHIVMITPEKSLIPRGGCARPTQAMLPKPASCTPRALSTTTT